MFPPDPPSRHHLPFDKLMALSKTEGPFDRPFGRLTVLSIVEGLRCLRSLLSFDLEALERLAAPYI
jgi:hypothetical protein